MVFSKCSSCFPVVFVTVSSGHSDDIFSLNWLSKHICEVSCYQTNYYCCQWCAKHCTNCFVNLSLSHSLTVCLYIYVYIQQMCGLPWRLSSEQSVCLCWRHRFNPWVKKTPWRRKWQPTPVFLPGEFHRQRSLVDYRPWVMKDSDTT